MLGLIHLNFKQHLHLPNGLHIRSLWLKISHTHKV